ncbi:hypothetical protein ZIOFF_011813 [Zingiber officinale]|uniref:Zinc finger, CCHC-type n=1 Tax=Zingiber officinale TaxID=94328 RepID=A0A8J5HNL4_ZINOF|nr:hypothetical protein ZIOFF_011813 [Zingiber officinale]
MKILYILDPNLEDILEPTDEEDEDLRIKREKRKEDELMCHGHILNVLSDRLYDVYTNTASAKEIWQALENKHNAKEGTKKFKKKLSQEEAKINSIEMDNIMATTSHANVVQGKVLGWWYDTCATVHVAYDKSLFKTYQEIEGMQGIQMGNEGHSKVVDMNRNLVSGELLNKAKIKAVYEYGKLIL